MKLIFCSHNRHKAQEIAKLLPKNIELLSLADLNYLEDIEENAVTFEGNAYIKAHTIWKLFRTPCFADDSGLEVEALNLEPGVYSARYAGPDKDDNKNMDLLLQNLEGQTNRAAHFKTVICLIRGDDDVHYFEGRVEGEIRKEKSGSQGFGYDPVFEPENCGRTFAEMSSEEKNKMSHRARAIGKMMDFLTC
ncbi:MAG: deoxyribonucleotide triphosphate pyrophosphatase [Crocinitomicaceae bacterium]|jgi:XTP/dITP diphosphohydrolase|nr:deoxyribonucleotide triphosphate pyrophosphatase [Crocinitomicaceae bacterium]